MEEKKNTRFGPVAAKKRCGQCMDPKVWGPALWSSIHRIALGYPDRPTPSDVDAYQAFFDRLGDVLPCAACRRAYQSHVTEHLPVRPFLLGGRSELFRWTVELHNLVNREKGAAPWTVERALAVHGGGQGPSSDGAWSRALLLYAVLVALVAVACIRRT